LPSLLHRLAKNCKFTPYLRIWWDNAQEGLPEKEDDIKREHRAKLLAELDRNWDLPNWFRMYHNERLGTDMS